MAYVRVCFLGCVDGLIVGVVMESLYRFYDAWEWKRADEFADRIGLKTHVDRVGFSYHNRLVIPLLFVVAFALAALLLRWLLRNRNIAPIAFWVLTAVTGVTGTLLVYFFGKLRIDVQFLAQPIARYDLLGIFWTWLACIVIGSLISLIFGIIVHNADRRNLNQSVVSSY